MKYIFKIINKGKQFVVGWDSPMENFPLHLTLMGSIITHALNFGVVEVYKAEDYARDYPSADEEIYHSHDDVINRVESFFDK